MKALKLLKNSAGISMVEVMMAVSVMGGLSLTVAQLMKNTSESTKQNEAKQENVNLKALIQNNLGVPQACKNTFGALITQANLTAMTGTGTVAVPNIRNKVSSGTILYSSTTNLHPLTITTMVLTNYVAGAGTADLVINANFKKSTNNIVMVKPIKIPINFNIDNTNPALPALISCSSMAVSGGEWMLAGNAGTVDGTDYIGTSDNQPLNFRINNRESGRVDSAGQTFFGYNAGSNLPYGTSGTAFGSNALAISTGSNNTAIGADVLLSNTTGSLNTAVGYLAMRNTTTGYFNTAIGKEAMVYNTSGSQNTAVGKDALMNNAGGMNNTALGMATLQGGSGSMNTAVGANALNYNTGSFSVAMGFMSAFSNTGSNVTAIGAYALRNNAGADNIAVGNSALNLNTTGVGNVAIGASAGSFNSTGSYNLFLGNGASNPVGNASNRLFIETSGSTTPLIGGNFLAGSRMVTIDGKLGIGTSTPGTPSTPVVATAGVTKLHVTGGKTILDQEAWTNITYANGWSNTPGRTGRYYKDSMNRVWLEGIIYNGLCPGVINVALPVGYRPVVQQFVRLGSNYDTLALFFINTDGTIQCVTRAAATAEIYLHGVSFPIF